MFVWTWNIPSRSLLRCSRRVSTRSTYNAHQFPLVIHATHTGFHLRYMQCRQVSTPHTCNATQVLSTLFVCQFQVKNHAAEFSNLQSDTPARPVAGPGIRLIYGPTAAVASPVQSTTTNYTVYKGKRRNTTSGFNKSSIFQLKTSSSVEALLHTTTLQIWQRTHETIDTDYIHNTHVRRNQTCSI